jgi:hypothetical protein
MHHRALRTISLIVGLVLVTFGCATGEPVTGKNQISDFPDIELSAETVPEGIRVTFSNFSNIPPEIDFLTVAFVDWAGGEEPDGENNEPLAIMNSFSNRRVSQTWKSNAIEQVRQTGAVTFPFVQSGHRYDIMAVFANNELPAPECVVKTITAECVADSGIYLDRNITLTMNDACTGVALSGEPAFTSDVQFGPQKMQYAIILHKGDYTEAIGSYTDDLFWNFEPGFSEHLKEAGVATGDYPATVGASLNVIHDDISWLLEIAYTPVFTYSL